MPILFTLMPAAEGAQQIAPQVGEWRYRLCDHAPSYWWRWPAWCDVLENGTWTYINGYPACVDKQPITDEGVLVPKAEEFSRRVNAACEIHSSWGGWLQRGETLPVYNCSGHGPVIRNGIEISNRALIEVWGNRRSEGKCTVGWSERIVAERYRQLQCPEGYTGTTVCTLRENTPNPHKNNESCPAGANGTNPIHSALGTKLQHETDYVGSGAFALRFERYYTSAGHWESAAIGTQWRHTYARRIQLISTSSIATATVFRPNGDRFYFTRQSDDTWRSDRDVVARLERTSDGWRYTDANETRELYDAEGRLLSISRRGGYTQTLEYDSDGRLAAVRDDFGRTLGFSYDSGGRIGTLTDPAGGIYEFRYDASGNLNAVTRPQTWNEPEAPTRTYLYEDARFPHALTGIVDENGQRYATWAYDPQGRAVLSEHGEGADRTELVYNADGTTSVTSATGTTRRYAFETIEGVVKLKSVTGGRCPSCAGDVQARTYDDNGFLASETDWNGVTTAYMNDARGLQISRTEAVGNAEERTTQTEWHPEFRLPVRIVEPRKVTEYEYDTRGLMLRRTERDRETGAERNWTYTYNAFGLVATADGPRTDVADVTRYDYDAEGNLITTTNAAGHTSRVTAHDAHGRPLALVDANGLSTNLSYDARGRLISRDVGGEITGFEYDGVGNLTRIALPDGSHLVYTYDEAHRLVGIADQLGHRIEYTLDPAGNRTGEKVYDEANSLARTRERVYDELGRLIQDIGASDQTNTYAYDGNGNPIAATDPLGNTTTSAFDALNRLVEQTDPLGGSARYGYDAQGELVSVTDPNSNTTTYTYDGLGNRIREASPDAGITSFTYDAAGNPVSKTDARGQTTRYRYDPLNRLVEASHADGTSTQYHYDTAPNGIGRLARIADPSGATEWDYDRHGRTIAKRQTIGSQVFETRYEYDAAGRLAAMTYPSGTRLEYAYANGRLEGVAVNGTPLVSDIGYTPFGPANGWRWGNGTLHSRNYDADGQLTAHSLADDTRTLSYDPIGNITEIADSRVRQIFDYDALSRLTAANDPTFEQSFAYDANGNRLELREGTGSTAYEYAPDSNRLLAVAANTRRDYQYDANGNTVHDGNHAYTYDARNRLVAVDDGRTAQYRLNALGQRVYKETPVPGDANGDGIIDQNDIRAMTGRNADSAGPGADCNGDGVVNQRDIPCVAQKMAAEKSGKAPSGGGGGEDTSALTTEPQLYFVYDEQGQLIGEYDQDGNAVREMIWLQNLPIGLLANGSLHHIHPDHLGTPRAITDQTGTVVWRWDSDPFGTTAANDDPDGDGQKMTLNLRFPGQYYDGETGLHYNYLRDYDPGLGRYIESDPIGMDAGLNTHTYVSGNPLRSADPFGLVEWAGTYTGGGLFVVGGAGVHYFELVSECVNGYRASANVLLIGVGIGGSIGYTTLPVSAEEGLIFQDYLDTPDPSVFAGQGGMVTAGVSFAPSGWGVREITLGGAKYERGTGRGATGGIDVGGYVMTGTSSLIGFSFENCNCE